MRKRVASYLPELLRHLFKKPVTVQYPFQKLKVPKDFRGSPVFHAEKCIGCHMCERDCPAEAIEIITLSKEKKKFKMILHNDRCIHCAQCVDTCPTDTYTMDAEFELAAFDRHALKIEFMPEDWPPEDEEESGDEDDKSADSSKKNNKKKKNKSK